MQQVDEPTPVLTSHIGWENRFAGVMLFAGILLRFLVFLTASPFNADWHFEVIQYIADQGKLPASDVLSQSYHPPLYYLLMTPLYLFWADAKSIQFVSFVLSSTNLVLIARVLQEPMLRIAPRWSLVALGFACFLPEFVMFGSFVSNDTLAFLLGTLLFLTVIRYVKVSSFQRLCVMGIVLGICLLTKGTFLLTGAAIVPLILWRESDRDWRIRVRSMLVFCLLWISIGCYKYVENAVRLGRPFFNNQDIANPVSDSQRGTWKGVQTLVDINIVKLIHRPILQTKNTFSYPLLMYATFWYTHIPDSSYQANINGYQWVGSVTYAFAVISTLLFLLGAGKAMQAGWNLMLARESVDVGTALVLVTSLLLLLTNAAVVIAAGVKYDIWSCFQSRLCFQSMLPILVLFCAGAQTSRSNSIVQRILLIGCWATIACGVLYFGVEIPFALGYLPRFTPVQP